MMHRRATFFLSAAIAGLTLCFAPTLSAAAPDTLLEKILGTSSGAFGVTIQVILLLLSIFMVGWTIECFINMRRDKLVPPDVIATLQGYIDEGDLEGALQYCEAAPNMLTRTIAAPLSRMHNGLDAMAQAMEQQLSVEAGKLATHISPLSLVTALGPMMGLFGTVSGMVMAFDEMALKGENMSPGDVAGSIGLALMSTVVGLVVAIPGMTFFWIFSNRVSGIAEDIGQVADEMFDTLRGYVQQEG
ncbi:MAG: MotA/TolQ/ExbB proton channel family protein [Planctomycetaceae bacterium]|nr:MotA/TolQ/ExbB proton channel family protein [Planctomycetaceae bacterium]